MTDEAYEATPNHELERQIMSYNEPKNEREWWAMHEIKRLREALREVVDWAEELGLYADAGTVLAPVFVKARAALGEEK